MQQLLIWFCFFLILPVSSYAEVVPKESTFSDKKNIAISQDIAVTKHTSPVLDTNKNPASFTKEMMIHQAESLMDDKLDEEIALANDLLNYETACEEVSKIRFRLADMHWEKSKRSFFKENSPNLSAEEKHQQSIETKKLQTQSIDHYLFIMNQCPHYSDMAKIYFYYGKLLTELERYKEGFNFFNKIIDRYPHTEWVSQSWFMVGEYYFNIDNNAHKALYAYKKSAQYGASRVYGFALYKQGWCYINLGEWDVALNFFYKAIKVSDDKKQPLDVRLRRGLRKEALRDYVRAYANVGDVHQAYTKFREIDHDNEWPQMLENLGNWYINQDAHDKIVVVYKNLIEYLPKSNRLPIFQARIIDATSKLGTPKTTLQESKKLANMLMQAREHQVPNQTDKDKKDLADSEELVESTLRHLGLDYHKQGQIIRGIGQRRMYTVALEMYKNYLSLFPVSLPNQDIDYSFYINFYYAELLFQTENFLEAANYYQKVVEIKNDLNHIKNPKEKEIVISAAEGAIRALDILVDDFDKKNSISVSGSVVKNIPPLKLHLLDACKRYTQVVGAQGNKIVEVHYKMARIYYMYNHFDEALPDFLDIIEHYPNNIVACYSANLVLDIYNGRKDYQLLKNAAHSYLENKKLNCSDNDKKLFAKIEEQSYFYLLKYQFEKNKKYLAAALAYLEFYKKYPQSQFADVAVYNAAVNYDLAYDFDKANETRRALIEKFPNSSLVPETLYNVAQSYERIVDFVNAAKYLNLFAARYPNDKRSKDAIYNEASYLTALQDYAGAIKAQKKYIENYPNDPEVVNISLTMCEMLEKQNKWPEAQKCYEYFIKKVDSEKNHTDVLCYAYFKRSDILYYHLHDKDSAMRQRNIIYKQWPLWQKNGAMPKCTESVAALKFRDLEEPFLRYIDMRISALNPDKKAKKRFDTSLNLKIKERDRLVLLYKDIVQLGVAHWSLMSLLRIGDLYQDSIEKLLLAPIPNKIADYDLSDTDKSMLRGQLRKMAEPIENLAIEAYKLCVDKANDLGIYSNVSLQAQTALKKMRPQEYSWSQQTFKPLDEFLNIEKFHVERNGFVILDGDNFKSIHLNLTDHLSKEVM